MIVGTDVIVAIAAFAALVFFIKSMGSLTILHNRYDCGDPEGGGGGALTTFVYGDVRAIF